MDNKFGKNEKINLDLKRTQSRLLVEEAELEAAEAAAKATEAAKKLSETKALVAAQAKQVRIDELGLEIKKNAYVIYEASDNVEILTKTVKELTLSLEKANKDVAELEKLISSKRASIASLNNERVKLGGSQIDIDSKVSVTQQINISSLSKHKTEAAKAVVLKKKPANKKKR